MAQPSRSQVHVNRPLTNISIAYIQRAEQFIADRVFPVVPVNKQSDRYFVYERENWFRIEAEERAPSTESAGGGWVIDNTPSYFCRTYSIHKDLDDQIRTNADDPLDMDRDSTEWVTQQLMLKKEKLWATQYFASGIWTNELSGIDAAPGAGQFLQWDHEDSDPIMDITNAGIMMAELTSYRPNVLVLTPYVFNALKNHPDIIDRIKYTQMGMVTQDIMAGLFEVDRILIPWGVENIALEGSPGDYNFIFGKNALLLYANPTPSILTPSAGYTFSWTGLYGAGAIGSVIKTLRMEHLESDRIEGSMAFDHKVIAPDLGFFFEEAVA